MAEIKVGIMVPHRIGSHLRQGYGKRHQDGRGRDQRQGRRARPEFTTVTADDGCDPQMATAAAASWSPRAWMRSWADTAPAPPCPPLRSTRTPACRSSSGSQLHQVHRSEPGQRLPDQRHRDLPGRHGGRPVQEAGCQKNSHHPPGRRLFEDLASLTKTRWTGMGHEVVAFEVVNKGEQDHSALVTRIKSKAPDLVFWTAYYADGAWSSSSFGRAATRARSRSATAPRMPS